MADAVRRGSFLLKQNVFIVAVRPEFLTLPPPPPPPRLFGLPGENERPSQKDLFLLVDLLTSAIASIDCFLA